MVNYIASNLINLRNYTMKEDHILKRKSALNVDNMDNGNNDIDQESVDRDENDGINEFDKFINEVMAANNQEEVPDPMVVPNECSALASNVCNVCNTLLL